jgi:hypothetical protein
MRHQAQLEQLSLLNIKRKTTDHFLCLGSEFFSDWGTLEQADAERWLVQKLN